MSDQMKIPLVQTPASRNTDPDTSHEAENEINLSGQRKTDQLNVLKLVKKYPFHTSRELAQIGHMDRYCPSRRLPELETGGYVCRGEKRMCRVGRRNAMTWEITDKGLHLLG